MPIAPEQIAPVLASSQVGLSAHARALWRRAARLRRVADELAAGDGGAAYQ